ncbi:MAG: type I secretion system permease/ATPase [Rhizobiaceae bacterium]
MDQKTLSFGSFRWLAVFSVATNLLLLVPPIYMLQLYDRVLSSGSHETLIYISLIALIAMALFGIAEAVRNILAQMASARFAAQVDERLFSGLTTVQTTGKAGKAARDFDTVRSFLASRSFIALFDLPFTPVFIAVMALLHPLIGLFAIFGCIALATVAYLNRKATQNSEKNDQRKAGTYTGFAQSVVGRADELRALGLLGSVQRRRSTLLADAVNSRTDTTSANAVYYGLSRFIRKALQIIIMGTGAWLVLQGRATGGVIFAASMLTGRALQPIEQLIASWDSIANVRAALARIDGILAGTVGKEQPIPLPEPAGDITVDGLSHATEDASNGRPLLSGISFHLPAGQVLAVTGASGSGKSTLLKLLAGALLPSAGVVKLDGAALAQWHLEQWADNVGYMPQDAVLFPGTVLDNITRFSNELSDEKLYRCVERSGIHRMITALPNGYRTAIGPDRFQPSSSQRNQLAFARALYSDPRVLILDEPNTSFDAGMEKHLLQTLDEARQNGRTVVIASKQRRFIDFADLALELKDGRQSFFGQADALRKRHDKSAKVQRPAANNIASPSAEPLRQPPAAIAS